MHFIRITDDARPEELLEAITHLRAKREQCGTETIRAEIDEDIDDLLDLFNDRTPA